MPDVAHISLCYPVVDEVGVEIGKVEACDCLDQQHQQDEIDLVLIRTQVSLEYLCEQAGLLLFRFPKPTPERESVLAD